MQRLVLKRLGAADEIEFDELVSLYEVAFPDSERKSAEVLRRMLACERYHFLLAKEEEHIVGCAIVYMLSGGPVALLEYMAVVPEHRGRGIGRWLVGIVAAELDSAVTSLLIEVESEGVECVEQLPRRKRKQFYRSLGAREIEGLRWMMPQVAAMLPPAMEMMVLGFSKRSVSRQQLRLWLVEVYVSVYGQRMDDLRIDAMLQGLPDEVGLV